MSPALTRAGQTLALGVLGAATTVLALQTWRGLTDRSGDLVGPVLLLAVALLASGTALRTLGTPRLLVALAQAGVATVVVVAQVAGGPPVPATIALFLDELAQAAQNARVYPAPVPVVDGGLAALLLVGAAVALWLADTVAPTFRGAPVLGLPLLAVISLPVTVTGSAGPWWLFALVAGSYLALVAVQAAQDVRGWGRPVTAGPGGPGSASGRRGVPVGAVAAAGVATTLALVVPPLVPTLDLGLVPEGRFGGSTGDEITVANPVTDLRAGLQRGDDVPLLTVRTDGPRPSYLRISALTRFNGEQWSAGDRDLPDDHTAQDPVPELQGVSSAIPREEHELRVSATDDFVSTWLPVPAAISAVDADAGWKYDATTMDFIAAEDELTTRGESWEVTAVELQVAAGDLAGADAPAGDVEELFLDVPGDVSPRVGELAAEVTAGAGTPYERAVALQEYLRSDEFTYDLDARSGTGGDALDEFLFDTRVGYCEQFSAAMALMARQVGVPARVAVGFLHPDRMDEGVWEYSAHDLHAWPELYFRGAGWVRFEPTPAARTGAAPAYSEPDTPGSTPDVPRPTSEPSASAPGAPTTSAGPDASPDLPDAETAPDAATGAEAAEPGRGPWRVLAVAAGLLLLAALLLLPRALRRRRVDRHARDGAEGAWAELRAGLLDHGVPWPVGLTPAATTRALVADWERDLAAGDRPGAALPDDALRDLEHLVTAVERERYAAGVATGAGADLVAAARRVVAARCAGSGRVRRALATWLPASVLRRDATATRAATAEDDDRARASVR
ncbi:transglutaminaseTgpA domain-containing protein [Nocardioides sp. CPCC 205120]|uniref:transglutaminase family protein n=1 Tax=Nocardioides sp. CPCC 205120 TaxID=3406462 RepID=UPI003B50F128